jgi:hypothetical protein
MKNIFKYVILEQLLTENRIQQAKDKYPCLPPKLIDYLSNGDPSGNNKYLDWMCKQVWDSDGNNTFGTFDENQGIYTWLEDNGDYNINNPTSSPDCQKVWSENYRRGDFNVIPVEGWLKDVADYIIEEVVYFNRFSGSLEKKDINSYSYDTLAKALAIKKLQSKEKELAKDVTKIYEDSSWLIVSPKSHQASCTYGANTKWCVTTKNNPEYFKRYTNEPQYLIFVINKGSNQKWAINTARKQGQESEEEVTVPWHKEVKNLGRRYVNPENVGEKFGTIAAQKTETGRRYAQAGEYQTTYWNPEDYEIGWGAFIKESSLPKNLQELLKFVEKRVKVNFQKKEKNQKAYETNPNPIRLKKGDKVKLLASGYGLYKGDEGYVISTYIGAPGREREVYTGNAGVYVIHVNDRKLDYEANRGVNLKKTDKLLTKLKLSDPEKDNFRNYESYVNVTGIPVNGLFLQKIK